MSFLWVAFPEGKMKPIIITICFLAFFVAGPAPAANHYVPEYYPTIQAAIDAAENGDTIILAPQTHLVSSSLGIDLEGKKITVRSTNPRDPEIVNSTIIDCRSQGRAFIFQTAEDQNSTIAGLTITNGAMFLGGAIYCYNNSSPSITDCVIVNNSAFMGGAIVCANNGSHPEIKRCWIKANSAAFGGGGIYCTGGSPRIRNCIISGNFAPYGGAIYSYNPSEPVIDNCTITGNTASDSAGGIYCYNASNLALNNTVLWRDVAGHAPEILVGSGNADLTTSIRIAYCDIQDSEQSVICNSDGAIDWGQDNIDLDPRFVDAACPSGNNVCAAGDYYLLPSSPCIDAGDPAFVAGPGETDIDGDPRVAGVRVDIGADEYAVAITATVRVYPRALNIASNGKWISCIIALPDNYDVANVDTSTITLESIGCAWSRIDIYARTLLTKFDRSIVQTMLKNVQSPVSLTVAGNLNDGTRFEGTDTIRIVRGQQ
jgi:parallel beta-helix repeat protein